MKFPNELYAVWEKNMDENCLIAIPDAEGHAVVGETRTAMLYRKVGLVQIKAPLEVSKPK